MISVIIPTYNKAQYIRECVDSVLFQTVRDIEIIVVDDGSTDNTKEMLAAYERKIRYIYQENRERAAARNNGILHAKGEYVAFLDSDDTWLPRHLELCLETLNKASLDTGLCYSLYYLVDKQGREFSKFKEKPFKGEVLRDMVSKFSSGGCNSSSCLIKKEIFAQAGYFNENKELSFSGEDWEMWVRIAAITRFAATGAYTVKVRSYKTNMLLDVEKQAKSMTKALDVVYQNPGILPKIRELKRRAYSSLYVIIAMNYYAAGQMAASRRYLKSAFLNFPLSLFLNRYLSYTFLRTLLGFYLSSRIRKLKSRAGISLYHKKQLRQADPVRFLN